MEIRLIQSFLTVVQEGTIIAAAQKLNISQPSLSMQMKKLEDELGVQLFERGKHRITLTEAGLIFHKRGHEIMRLVTITEEETSSAALNITTTLRIGANKTKVTDYIAAALKEVRNAFPNTKIEMISGDSQELLFGLHQDLLDLGLIFCAFDENEYEKIAAPPLDILGLYMRKDDPLAKRSSIPVEMLPRLPLIASRMGIPRHFGLADDVLRQLKPVAVFNLMASADSLIGQGIGYGLCHENLIDTSEDSELTFRPITPTKKIAGSFIWKREGKKSPPLLMLIEELKNRVS